MNNKKEYIRKVIGVLIKHYRKQNSFYVNDFIYENDDFYRNNCIICNQCNNAERICSKNTLYRLEEGKVIQNECVYHRLAHKLGKRVILNRMGFYIKLETYRSILIESLIDFSKSKITKLEAQITHDLCTYKDVLYISEILLLYKSIIQDKLYSTKTEKKDIQTFLNIKDALVDEDRKLVIYYLYSGSFKRGDCNIDFEQIMNESKKYIDDPLFYKIKLDFINTQSHMSALKYFIENEIPNLNSLTPYQKYCFYTSLEYPLINSYAFEESYEVLIKCKEIVESSDFGDMILKNCYLRLGFISYCLEHYEETETWMMKAFEINHSIAKNLVILCSALEKMGKIDTIIQILKKTDTSKMKSIYGKKVYIYYKRKYGKAKKTKNDILELEDYICNEIKPFLDTYGSVHKEIFQNDLIQYVKKTKNFEKYYYFTI